MAVAVKNASEAASRSPLDRLAVSSLAGVVYVLGTIGVVFYAVPAAWDALLGPSIAAAMGSFVNVALKLLAMAGAATGLVILAFRMVGPSPAKGLRAGTGIAIISLLFIGWLTLIFGWILQAIIGSSDAVYIPGLAATGAVGLGLLYLFLRMFFRPSFEDTLGSIEEQGWFSATMYKGSQGQRVRRGTMLAILLLGGCGIYTLLSHHTLEAGATDWTVTLPFMGGRYLVLLGDVRFTVPLLFGAATLWLGFRIVHFPAFADFLIATEAEMNKVSWSSRKRLVQDTIVVLVTVFLLTFFLMMVDLMWGWLLSWKYIGVLQIDQTQQQVEEKEQPW
jgi:preprotein translocase SecE subunit